MVTVGTLSGFQAVSVFIFTGNSSFHIYNVPKTSQDQMISFLICMWIKVKFILIRQLLISNNPHRPAGINKTLVNNKIKLSVLKRVLKQAEERTEARTATKWTKSKPKKHSNGSEQNWLTFQMNGKSLMVSILEKISHAGEKTFKFMVLVLLAANWTPWGRKETRYIFLW